MSVLTVALNEEEGLRVMLPAIHKALTAHGIEYEIVVVDGGSNDATKSIASPHARVINSPTGYGRQYLRGFDAVTGDVIVTLDADDSYPPTFIPVMLEALLDEDLEFVSANRYPTMEMHAMSRMHAFGNFVLTLCSNVFFGLSLADSQSGMWCFRSHVLPRLVLTRPGMAFSEELKLEAFRKCRSREIAGQYRRRRGRAKIRSWRDGLGNLFFLVLRALEERTGLSLGTGYHAAHRHVLREAPRPLAGSRPPDAR